MNRKKRQAGSWVANSFRPQGSKPQISFKWGARPIDPFEEEAKRNRLLPPERLMADKLNQYKSALRHEVRASGDDARRQAVEMVLTESDLPRNLRELQDKEAELFTKDFMCWLQGKHPKKESDPAYISHRLKQYGVMPNHGPLHGPGITEFIKSTVDKKAQLHAKIAVLAQGPNRCFPWTIEHYWLFYKYLLRDKPFLEDEMLVDFDKFWPNESDGRVGQHFKGLGDTQWSSYGGRTKDDMVIHDECEQPRDKMYEMQERRTLKVKRGVSGPENLGDAGVARRRLEAKPPGGPSATIAASSEPVIQGAAPSADVEVPGAGAVPIPAPPDTVDADPGPLAQPMDADAIADQVVAKLQPLFSAQYQQVGESY